MLDVDSTLAAIEGIDWLAGLRGEAVRRQVAEATDRVMRGEARVGDVYTDRLMLIAPTRSEIAALADEYVARVQPGARECLAKLTNAGVRIILVTAALTEAVRPLAEYVGVPLDQVNAVPVFFEQDGQFAGFADSPLTRNGGKAAIVRSLGLQHPIVGVGDGITDLELRILDPPAVDAFVAYAGVVEREPIVRAADYVVRSFKDLLPIVLG